MLRAAAVILMVLLPYTLKAQVLRPGDKLDSCFVGGKPVALAICDSLIRRADSLHALCAERGHLWGPDPYSWVTAMCCPGTSYVDLPDRTLAISTDPNCRPMRCGRCDSSHCRTVCDTTVVWAKGPKP